MTMKKKARLNLFTALGWLVWKILAVFGLPYAKSRLARPAAGSQREPAAGSGSRLRGFGRRHDRA